MTKVDDFLAITHSELGKPYVFGAEGPATFDCSGLVQYALGLVGVKSPRTSQEQQAWATPVTSPLPGDLVFYGRPATHVGVYIGNGQMIDAPDVGKDVEIDNVGSPTSYGRVPGLGTGLQPAVATLTGLTLPGLPSGSQIVQNARKGLLITVAVLLALGLVVLGGYAGLTRGKSKIADLREEVLG